MVAIFGGVAMGVLAALGAGMVRFWRAGPLPDDRGWDVVRMIGDVLTLRHASGSIRWFHHFTFYGFLLCFASTSVAAFYHYALARRAPYAFFSLPVVLGILGGIGLLIGPVGLFRLRRRDATDLTFLVLLFAASFTGLVLLALRQSRAMAPLLVVHLAIVLALFVSLPYGKFVHGIYRAAALVRYAMEEHGGRESQSARQR
jgi:citrate/tricarballylate utilization protein